MRKMRSEKQLDDLFENENAYIYGSDLVTPANIETGVCPYIYKEEYDLDTGCNVYCDFCGSCDFKSYITKTDKGMIHICNMVTKHGR